MDTLALAPYLAEDVEGDLYVRDDGTVMGPDNFPIGHLHLARGTVAFDPLSGETTGLVYTPRDLRRLAYLMDQYLKENS